MSEQYFEKIKENFDFDSESQYSTFCEMFKDWQSQQIMEEINKETE